MSLLNVTTTSTDVGETFISNELATSIQSILWHWDNIVTTSLCFLGPFSMSVPSEECSTSSVSKRFTCLNFGTLLFFTVEFDVTLVQLFSLLLLFFSFRIVLMMSFFSAYSFPNFAFSIFNCSSILRFFNCSILLRNEFLFCCNFEFFLVNNFDVRKLIHLFVSIAFA